MKWSHFVLNVVKKKFCFSETLIFLWCTAIKTALGWSWKLIGRKWLHRILAFNKIQLTFSLCEGVHGFPFSLSFIWIPERLTLIIWNDRFVMITLFDTPEKQTCVKVLLASASSLPKYTERRRTSDLNSRIKVSITRIQLKLHFYQ